MPSLLTLQIFRQLTNSVLHTETSALIGSRTRCCRHIERSVSLAGPAGQTRTIFGFARKKKKPPPSKFKPGFELMMICKDCLRSHERPPPPDELATAFVDFFKSHSKIDGGVSALEDVQLEVAKPIFIYLQKYNKEMDGFGFSDEDLRLILGVLRSGATKTHLQMATLLFEELIERRSEALNRGLNPTPIHVDLVPYIWILCQNGGALLARDLLETSWSTETQVTSISPGDLHKKLAAQWATVLRGLIRERRNSEVEKTVDIMREYSVPFDSKIHQIIVTYCAHVLGDMAMTKKWYSHPIADSASPTSFTDANVLRLCINKDEISWGKSIFEKLIERNPDDRTAWNIILQWCAANGKGVDEIEAMMKVMAKRNRERPDLQPGMDTINALIEYASDKNDPYTAERYYALGQRWGFQPNARTYILQLNYRINVKDLSGALVAYNNLQSETPPENEDIPYINKLIVALITQTDQRYDAIMGLVEDLRERRADFNPETVAALALLHISRDEMQDYSDLMATYVHNYSASQRQLVRDALLDVVLSEEVDERRAWETYEVLQDTLQDSLNRDLRVKIMQSFFNRSRGDMGLHTFGHMRKAKDQDMRPDLDIYCLCLEGIAKSSNYAAVQLIHNMLTMDEFVEPNTKTKNALMLGYVGAGAPDRARNIWEDVINSREGPTYSSIQIALRACEGMGPHGDRWLEEVWAKVKRMDIEITREIFAAYIGALAAGGMTSKCWELLENAERECGSRVDALM